MAIVKTVFFTDFLDSFKGAGRDDNFTYEGKRILFDYLEALSEDMGEPVELDVIALCCEYEELSIDDLIETYPDVEEDIKDGVVCLDDERGITDILSYYTMVCGSYYCEEQDTTVFVFQSF